MASLTKIDDARGFIVTSKGLSTSLQSGSRDALLAGGGANGGTDFESRFFAPRFGIDEDPVTGSAHCCLAPYWAKKLGRNSLVGYQASARGGTLWVTHVPGQGRVLITGQATTVFKGFFRR
ncbi:unnamed protein product [Discosporangium mesarthrocarpum]